MAESRTIGVCIGISGHKKTSPLHNRKGEDYGKGRMQGNTFYSFKADLFWMLPCSAWATIAWIYGGKIFFPR